MSETCDQPVESGELDEEGEGGYVEPPPLRDDPVESGALEDDPPEGEQ
ncbi:MAG: hypothetical protein KY396_00420 [Actinobacteria bacterium]|nr:hypothetical protein [Actinomycetota bacterium]